jgi:capsule polysaccharide export protein KpsC/LpsZ
MARAFVDQKLILDLLDFYLPPDISIYVKEHPKQTIVGRNFRFYNFTHPRIKYIKSSCNSFDLIENSLAIATCTGTAGIEALFFEKPVLLFGDWFYKFAPGVFCIKTKQDLLFALDAIKNSFHFTEDSLLSFLQNVYNYSFDAHVDKQHEGARDNEIMYNVLESLFLNND